VARLKKKEGRLSVFKGREAKLNRAIFQTLALKGPQTIYGIHKEIKKSRGFKYTRYPSVLKRVKALEESAHLKRAPPKKTAGGFEITVYELAARGYLSIILDSVGLEELVKRMSENTALQILQDIVLDGEVF
jgi:hypothetical protein